MATPGYHRRQAEVLTRLANSTSDANTAAALRKLALEHATMADQVASIYAKNAPGADVS